MDGYEIGDTVELNGRSFTVCGIVINPMHIIKIEEQSFTEGAPLGGVLYVENPLMINDVYVTLEGRDDYTLFGRRYEKRINGIKAELNAALRRRR